MTEAISSSSSCLTLTTAGLPLMFALLEVMGSPTACAAPSSTK